MSSHPNALILDAMMVFLQDAPRDEDGALTQQAQADLHRIADLAKDRGAMASFGEWEEAKHARSHGKFARKGSGGGGGEGHEDAGHTETSAKGVLAVLKAAGASAAHAEHVASAYARDRVESAVRKLPEGIQDEVRTVFALARAGMAALFANFTAAQALAERVARSRGMDPEQARRFRGLLTSIDSKTFEVLKVGALAGHVPGLQALHVLHVPAVLSATIPVASAGYLAYAALTTNPLRTIAGAGRLVRDVAKTVLPGPQVLRQYAEPASPALALADALEAHSWDDWYIALLSAALDEAGSLEAALELTDRVYQDHPREPADREA